MIPGCATKLGDAARSLLRLGKILPSCSPFCSRSLEYQHTIRNTHRLRHGSHFTRTQTTIAGLAYRHRPHTLVQSDAQRRTIYALSTPQGKAGVAVIRVSGPDVLNVWRSMVLSKSKPRQSRESRRDDPEPWRMYRGEVVHPQTGELLDSGLAVYFKGKHT